MTAWLRQQGYAVNPKRVARLMQTLGLETIYPKPRTPPPPSEHRGYPYLLRGLSVRRPHQVWSTDITDIRLHAGFVYLVAIMDWFSRYVLSWAVSMTMDVECCVAALEQALEVATPEIFHSDQGPQFTSLDFPRRLEAAGIWMSMDGRGRALDNCTGNHGPCPRPAARQETLEEKLGEVIKGSALMKACSIGSFKPFGRATVMRRPIMMG